MSARLKNLGLSAVAVAAYAATLAANADSCSISPFPQAVLTNELMSFSIVPPEYQACADVAIEVTSAPTEGSLSSVGSTLMYKAPATETDDVASLTIKCPSKSQSCDLLIGFLVSAPPTTTPPPTTAAPSTGASGAPNVSTTTVAPTTTEAPLPVCTASASINVTMGLSTVYNTALPAKLEGCSGITTYRSDPSNPKGRLYVNLVGSVMVIGSQFETLDRFAIVASCDAVRMCTIPVSVVSYVPLTPPPTSTTAAPSAACPNIYYYEAPIGAVFSSSLRDMPGQPSCTFGRAFTVITPPAAGALTLNLNGDFTYEPPPSEGWSEYTFAMNCMGTTNCIGTARMLVTNRVSILPASTVPATTQPQIPFTSDGYTTCKGTCNEAAWKVLPGTSLVWDTHPTAVGNVASPRADKKVSGAVGVDFINGSLILKGYSQIGSLASRFLTFEPVSDFSAVVAEDSTDKTTDSALASFDNTCLANQPPNGFAEEVWRWQSLANKTGYVGIRYNSGSSYYHKFGGKHIGCDTFAAQPCRYAPLLTPNKKNWKVDVDGCDVTWTGAFNVSTLVNMRNSRNEKVFYYTSSKDVQGTVYSQGVTARSWLEPAMGVVSNTVPHELSMTFDTAVSATKLDAATPFTLDPHYFEYLEPNGDKAFGINLAFFSLATSTGQSFTPDRHVKGFRFLRTEWRSPARENCPTCFGTSAVCTVSTSASESAFTGNFSQGTCAGGLGIVTLKKGPAMTSEQCSGNLMKNQVVGRLGFSAPDRCSDNFQNLTIRGIAAGSRSTVNPIQFEGSITLQLLLDNGARPTVSIDLRSYVSRVAIDQGLKGSLEVCRSTPYWPIFDPLGDSLPDAPHSLWKKRYGEGEEHGHTMAPTRFMCLDQNDMRFGPTGWAVFSLDAPGVDASTLVVDSVFIQLPQESDPVFLLYRDPNTGLVTEPPAGLRFWKRTHPFLNFRFINNASKMSRSDHAYLSPTTTFGFAFTPGTFFMDSSMIVSAVVRSTRVNADGTTTSGAATFRRTIFIDPLLSAATRYGIPTVSIVLKEQDDSMTYELGVAAAATIGIILVGIAVISADEDRKLPKWMPRATIIKDIPVLGGVVTGKKKKKAPTQKINGQDVPITFNAKNFKNPYEAALGAAKGSV